MYYVTMQITFLTRKFRNVERNLHCDVVHITTVWVSSLTLDCNGVFAIKAYMPLYDNWSNTLEFAYIDDYIIITRCSMRETGETALLHVACWKPVRRRYCM